MAILDELAEREPSPVTSLGTGKGLSAWSAFRLSFQRGRVRDEYLIGGIVLAALLISVGLFFLRDVLFDAINLNSLGYMGVFLFSLLGSATIFLPSGGGAAIILAGAVLNPVSVGLL
ncbi:MAG: hypothetical protein V3U26_08235, partial [Dehalococcoidia bacterium]